MNSFFLFCNSKNKNFVKSEFLKKASNWPWYKIVPFETFSWFSWWTDVGFDGLFCTTLHPFWISWSLRLLVEWFPVCPWWQNSSWSIWIFSDRSPKSFYQKFLPPLFRLAIQIWGKSGFVENVPTWTVCLWVERFFRKIQRIFVWEL